MVFVVHSSAGIPRTFYRRPNVGNPQENGDHGPKVRSASEYTFGEVANHFSFVDKFSNVFVITQTQAQN